MTSPAQDMAPAIDAKYKVVFVGDSSTGKSSIIVRFMHDYFEPNYQATIGIDFLSKIMKLDDGRSVRLQLWDTAGQERFRSLIPSYIRDANAAVVVYDISSHESFENTTSWVEEIRKEREGSDVVLFLVGNKTDLGNSRRQVTAEEAQERAEELNMIYMECSAKAGYNVSSIFNTLANALPPLAGQPAASPWRKSNGVASNGGAGLPTVRLDGEDQAGSCGC